jgi:hypothetical protein
MRGSYLSWRAASPPELLGEPDEVTECRHGVSFDRPCAECEAEIRAEREWLARNGGRADAGGPPDDLEELPF